MKNKITKLRRIDWAKVAKYVEEGREDRVTEVGEAYQILTTLKESSRICKNPFGRRERCGTLEDDRKIWNRRGKI